MKLRLLFTSIFLFIFLFGFGQNAETWTFDITIPKQIKIIGNELFLSSQGNLGGVKKLDLTQSEPDPISVLLIPDNITMPEAMEHNGDNIILVDNYEYNNNNYHSIFTFNLNDIFPNFVQLTNYAENVTSMFLNGNDLYYTNTIDYFPNINRGIFKIDISEEFSVPESINQIEMNDLCIVDNMLYGFSSVANTRPSIIDLSNPSEVTSFNFYNSSVFLNSPKGLTYYNGYMYYCGSNINNTDKVVKFNPNQENPRVIEVVNLPDFTGQVLDIEFHNNHIYILESLSPSGTAIHKVNISTLITQIPDSNFEQALIDLGIDSNGLNGNILQSDAIGVTTLNLINKNIDDLSGIEIFTDLENLNVSENNLEDIDLGSLSKLTFLNASDNPLVNINENIFLNNNRLLETIALNNTNINLSSLNLSYNTQLKNLYTNNIDEANLEYLDLSNNILLEILELENTHAYSNFGSLTDISISDLVNLRELNINNVALNSLDISNNTMLTTLKCDNSYIEGLDLSSHPITSLYCSDNTRLKYLDISNGNNSNIVNFSATNNTLLNCIRVDDEIYSATNWNNVDETTSFSEDCSSIWEIFVPDIYLYNAIYNNTEIDTNTDGIITFEEAYNYTGILDVSNSNFTDLTGLAAFTNITELNLSNNNLTDISEIFSNESVIIVSRNNEYANVTHSQPLDLQILNVSNNNLEELDISSFQNLTDINCSNNALENLNVANGNNSNMLLNALSNSNLNCINVDNNIIGNIPSSWQKDNTASYNNDCEGTLSNPSYELENSITLYPNPTNSVLNIESSDIIGIKNSKIYALDGSLIVEFGDAKILDISNLSSGIYFLRVITNRGIVNKRVIKN